jgi:hypothetical protein
VYSPPFVPYPPAAPPPTAPLAVFRRQARPSAQHASGPLSPPHAEPAARPRAAGAISLELTVLLAEAGTPTAVGYFDASARDALLAALAADLGLPSARVTALTTTLQRRAAGNVGVPRARMVARVHADAGEQAALRARIEALRDTRWASRRVGAFTLAEPPREPASAVADDSFDATRTSGREPASAVADDSFDATRTSGSPQHAPSSSTSRPSTASPDPPWILAVPPPPLRPPLSPPPIVPVAFPNRRK